MSRKIKFDVTGKTHDTAALAVLGGLVPLDPVFQIHGDLESTDPSKARRRIIVSTTETISLRGDNFSADARANNSCVYLVGVLKDGRKTLRLYPADVFSVQRTLPQLQPLAVPSSQLKRDYAKTQTALGETFGSKKTRLLIKARERNRVDADALGASSLMVARTVKDSTVHGASNKDAADATSANQPRITALPPFNDKTDVVAQIYPVHGLIGKASRELRVLAGLFIEARGNADATDNLIAMYFGQQPTMFALEQMRQTLNKETPEVDRVMLSLYMHLLASLCRTDARQLRTPETVARAINTTVPIARVLILEHFEAIVGGVGNSGDRPKSHIYTDQTRIRLLMYTIVVGLRLSTYELILEPLARDLGQSVSKLAQNARNIGCTISTSVLGTIAELKAPLKLPTTRKARRAN